MSGFIYSPKARVALIACEIMKAEIDAVAHDLDHLETHYLDQGLHRTPTRMADRIQHVVDRLDARVDVTVLGYGLCANGIVGVKARRCDLIVPRCHDCIGFFLGSPQAYLDDFHSRPGSYYLTPGWIAEKKDPLSIIEEDYVPRYGRKKAEWAKKEELKHYTHMVLVDTGVDDLEPMRRIAMKNADYFGMQYLEIKARSREFFNKLVTGPYPEDEFFLVRPGEAIRQGMFFD
jgi:hypothetical protein